MAGSRGSTGFVEALECSRCARRFPPDEIHNRCPCGGPLLARYDLRGISKAVTRDEIRRRPRDMWRYRELLPLGNDGYMVSLQEGFTPIIPLGSLSRQLGLSEIHLKDEGQLPTGTFKARGAAVGISKAREFDIGTVALATAGNAGGAWATYGARAHMEVHVVMPADAPEIHKKECLASGAHLYLVKGFISDAGAVASEACRRYGWFSVSTFHEPYRVEGKKTLGFEIAEQFGWEFPEVILYPCGGGVGLIGIWKAFKELREMGWVGKRAPRMVAVQSDGCAPIVKAFLEGKKCSEPWPGPRTRADGLRVPKPLADFLILDAIEESGGCAVSVAEADIPRAMKWLAREEGILACPEGATTLLALDRLRRSGWVGKGDRVLLLNTGSGLKYPRLIRGKAVTLEKGEEIRKKG
ncbi:MAG: threonine synthase [Deltaproteobacteria bacterium]|nr:threonine synthase [Deltaproteobacteria bacterium]